MHGKYDKGARGCPAFPLARAGRRAARRAGRGQGGGQRCGGVTEPPHCMSPLDHLRIGLDIKTTEGMVTYFQSVLKERDKK